MIRDSAEYGDYEGRGGELYASDFADIRPGEYEWLTTVAGQEGGPICELACGHGRLCLPLARLGYEIVGMDRSTTLIRLAREALSQESESIQACTRFVVGDLRQFDLGRQFRYIFIFFGGFYCLERQADRLACLIGACDHLLPGGLLEIEDPHPPGHGVSRKEMEELFSSAGLHLEAALRDHTFPLQSATSEEKAVLYRVRRPG